MKLQGDRYIFLLKIFSLKDILKLFRVTGFEMKAQYLGFRISINNTGKKTMSSTFSLNKRSDDDQLISM